MPHKFISKKYIDLVSTSTVTERFNFYKTIALELESNIPEGMEIVASDIKLINVAYSYFYDIERYKDFHQSPDETDEDKKTNSNEELSEESNLINRYKIAAFTCKWINKLRPLAIQTTEPEKIQPNFRYFYTNLINALYSVKLASVIMDKSNLSQKFDDKLIYNLHYSSIDENGLILLFESTFKND